MKKTVLVSVAAVALCSGWSMRGAAAEPEADEWVEPAPAQPVEQPPPRPPPPPTPPAAPALRPAASPPPPPGYVLVPVEEAGGYDRRRARRASELSYDSGAPIPPGYRVVERPRRGLVIAGSILTGVFWMFSVTAAVASDYKDDTVWLMLPGVGPWLMVAAGGARNDCPTTTSAYEYCDDKSGTRALLALDGMVQTGGLIMFIAGLAYPKKVLVPQLPTVSLTPARMGRDGYGVGLVGSF